MTLQIHVEHNNKLDWGLGGGSWGGFLGNKSLQTTSRTLSILLFPSVCSSVTSSTAEAASATASCSSIPIISSDSAACFFSTPAGSKADWSPGELAPAFCFFFFVFLPILLRKSEANLTSDLSVGLLTLVRRHSRCRILAGVRCHKVKCFTMQMFHYAFIHYAFIWFQTVRIRLDLPRGKFGGVCWRYNFRVSFGFFFFHYVTIMLRGHRLIVRFSRSQMRKTAIVILSFNSKGRVPLLWVFFSFVFSKNKCCFLPTMWTV